MARLMMARPKRGRDTIFLLNYGTGIIPKEENM
jgi:hypothetical protein